MPAPGAKEIDRHVGQRLRQRRVELGLTQADIARHVGVTYQQAHKYETGISRISAGRLLLFARALGVGVTYFYDGWDDGVTVRSAVEDRMIIDLANNFRKIGDMHLRRALTNMARAMAEE